ncbi:MAG: hypothetical protein RR327_01985 [Clostridia bacterium]
MANTPMEAIVAQTLNTTNAVTKRAGYTYINGALIPNAIAALPARAIRAGRIVRPGVGMTEKFVSGINPNAVNSVTVQLMTNAGVHARTLRGGNEGGTLGNDGMINVNPKFIPSTSPFEIPLRQLEDQPWFFPQMQLETMIFDEVVETISNYYDNVNNGMDSYHVAKAMSTACHRAANNSEENVIRVDKTKAYTDSYMIELVNNLNAKLANGDPETQLMTFSGPRELVARPELIGWLKSPKTGFILNSDISTKLLMDANFDISEAERYGNQYRGNFAGAYEMQEAPQGIWTLVEKWLGLTAGALDGIYGVVFTPTAYAGGGFGKKDIKMLQSTQHDGTVAFPYIKYGGAAYRKMYIIADKNWTMPTVLNNKIYPAPVVAPGSWGTNSFEPIEKIVYSADGTPIGVETIANVLKPNGDMTVTTLKVTGTASAVIADAMVTATIGGVAIPTTNYGNGTYSFTAKHKDVVAVNLTKTGYKALTQNITVSASAKTIDIVLTAGA